MRIGYASRSSSKLPSPHAGLLAVHSARDGVRVWFFYPAAGALTLAAAAACSVLYPWISLHLGQRLLCATRNSF